ncbi:ribonuclease HII [Haloimpatiens sp. FM7330]|uniref:ribonuclease HII n=1 Tax=Haloimpatiens sp. FM7330 TaxID=3298610 RepID=UPI0036452D23
MKSKEVKEIIKEVENNYLDLDEEKIIKLNEKLLNDSRKTVQKCALSLIKYSEKIKNEIERVKNMYNFDRQFVKSSQYLAGVDEVGRGPLAGPIAAAAVVLNLNYEDDKDLILGIKDSKKLSHAKREELSEIIKSKAISYSIALVDNKQIDNRGIAWSNNKVFLESVSNLKVKPDIILSDGYRIRGCNIKNEAVIKGDNRSISIAAASIIAKVYRDNLMFEFAKKYKGYGFEKNVGYGTQEHIDAIHKEGITPIHRRRFLTNILNFE